MQLCKVDFEGKQITFAISNTLDEVQRYPATGSFYKIELSLMQRMVIPVEGMAVLDIGSNIGNQVFLCIEYTRKQGYLF